MRPRLRRTGNLPEGVGSNIFNVPIHGLQTTGHSLPITDSHRHRVFPSRFLPLMPPPWPMLGAVLLTMVAVGLCLTVAVPKEAGPMTTADLMVACYGDEGGPDRQFCLGYLLGIWDALPAGNACVKPGIEVSAGMLREMFLTSVGPLFPKTPAKDVPAGVAASSAIHHYFSVPGSVRS
jgi:hypothetical protein